MAKIKNNYESSWWPRLLQWLDDGSTVLDSDLEQGLDATSDDHLLPDEIEKEQKYDQRMQEALKWEQHMYEHVHQWRKQRGSKIARWLYRLLAVAICGGLIWLLLSRFAAVALTLLVLFCLLGGHSLGQVWDNVRARTDPWSGVPT